MIHDRPIRCPRLIKRRRRTVLRLIAQLTGRVDALSDGTCVIDVGGVGYLVQASSRTLSALPQPPAAAKVLIETHVRDDAIVLYGFADSAERDWFRLLTTVQGVGGRVALAILSALSPRDLIGAIAAGDKASLTRAQGVGPRLAIRLLTELKDKTGTMPASIGVSTRRSLPPPRLTTRCPPWSTWATAAPRRSRWSSVSWNASARPRHWTH